MVIKVCQGSTKALRNHLQAHHKKEFADMVKRSRRSSRPPTNCKTKSFQLLSDELSSVDQLGWGKHHETQFPLLAKLKVVFPVPAASSKSERVFSVAGSVVTPKTANLNPEKVEDLVVVKCNLRLLKSMGLIRK